MTGGLVRVTGSGLGCPTWPECADGSITPTIEQPEGFHKYIEFGNRTLTSVLVVLAAGDRGRRVAVGRAPADEGRALVVLGGVVAQAVLGGITVLLGLNPADRGRPLPALDGPGRRRRPTSGSPGTRRPVPPRPLVPPLVTAAGLGHRRRRRGRADPRHGCHRLRPALGRRRRAEPVRVRPAHRLVAARRPRHDLHRAGRRHLARGPAHRRRRRARGRRGPGWSCSRSRWPRA